MWGNNVYQTPTNLAMPTAQGNMNMNVNIVHKQHRPPNPLNEYFADPNEEFVDKSVYLCDYSDDIFKTMLETEYKCSVLGFRSVQGVYRPMLLHLLKVAAEKYKLLRVTLHLGVYLLDRFMDQFTVRPDKLNLVALSCLIVAAKLEESDFNLPKFVQLNKLVGEVYTVEQFKKVELKVLSCFQFDLIRPTAAVFAEYFANSLVTLDDYHSYMRSWCNGTLNYRQSFTVYERAPPSFETYKQMASAVSNFFFEIVDISLSYLKLGNTRPSLLAASGIGVVRNCMLITPTWNPYLIQLTTYTEEDITPYMDALKALYMIHFNNKRMESISAINGVVSQTSSPNVASDSCDSGIESGGLKCDSADEEEDEPYVCLEYPLVAKKRRLT